MLISWPVRLTTMTVSTTGERITASSTVSFSGTILPRSQAPSQVITTLLWASSMRLASACSEKPP